TISANDAAMALAQATGSLSQGMAVINAEARHLQADDTVAVTPNGLDAPGQHTSAYDLALFARQGLQMPAFLKYDRTTSGQFRISKKKSVGLWNQNTLLATYPGALGGKIGWTSAAGATYVGMARRHGVTLIVSLLHCPAVTAQRADRPDRAQSVGSGPSVLATAGFSCVALLVAGTGFAYSRRRSRA